MPPKLIREGKIRIFGQTPNSVVYAVDSRGLAHESPTVLKGGTVWYEGKEALGPGLNTNESNKRLQREARIYSLLGKSLRILECRGLEPLPESNGQHYALRLERAPYGNLRNRIVSDQVPPDVQTRVQMAIQLTEGIAHMHQCGVVWGDVSTRNVLLFNNWQIKLGDFADSAHLNEYPPDLYGCEARYSPPSSDNDRSELDVMKHEMFALGTGIYEISEWSVPYGSRTEEIEVMEALNAGKLPNVSSENPAQSIIRKLWAYQYESTAQVLVDLRQAHSRMNACGSY